MTLLRLSPSGPIIADIGPGFVVSQKHISIINTESAQGIDLQGAGEISLGPGNPPVAPAFSQVAKSDLDYVARVSALFDGRLANTNNLQVAIQYSNNAGVSWTDAARTIHQVSGIDADGTTAGQFRMDLWTSPLQGNLLLPVNTAQGEVLFRARAWWTGTSPLYWTSGTSGTGHTQLSLVEQLRQ